MTGIMKGIPSGKATDLRKELYNIFGSCAHFYRYRSGRYPVTPELQKSVAHLFHKHGIETEPHYDETTLSYYFLKEPHATTQQEA